MRKITGATGPRYVCPECSLSYTSKQDATACCKQVRAEPDAKPDCHQVGGDHYQSMGIAPWAIIDTWPMEQRIGAYRANALKYIMRAGSKGSAAEDARKAAHYCEKLAATFEGGR